MDFRISNLSNPIRICLDAPYLDGINNIKAALQPIDRKITYAIQRVQKHNTLQNAVDLSKRAVQFAVGVVLLIPGINIVIDLALRQFCSTNPNATYEPSTREISSNLDELVLKSILPNLLQFLRKNGMNQASIDYRHTVDGLPAGSIPLIPFMEFRIHCNEGNDLLVQMPLTERYSEHTIFERLKSEVRNRFASRAA
jgi:hypothetical protein